MTITVKNRKHTHQKDDKIKTIKKQLQALILAVNNVKDQNQINNFAQHCLIVELLKHHKEINRKTFNESTLN